MFATFHFTNFSVQYTEFCLAPLYNDMMFASILEVRFSGPELNFKENREGTAAKARGAIECVPR